MKNKNIIKTFMFFLVACSSYAQVQKAQSLQIGNTSTNTQDGSAALQIDDTTRGLLLPRMTSTQRDAIVSPAKGLFIFNTTTNTHEINTGTSATPVWSSAASNAFSWSTTGNTGTTPGTNFIGTSDNKALSIKTNNVEAVRVSEYGNVGIGTNTPTAALDINRVSPTGTISATGTTVSGIGTNFVAAFRVGDNIVANGILNTVTAIASDTELTVANTWTVPSGPYATYRLNISGSDAMINSVPVGRGAGSVVGNVILGFNALSSNTTGAGNTAIGDQTLIKNTTGANNTAVGLGVLNANTTGINNTGVGLISLLSNTTGQSNTAIGLQALTANTEGSNNTAVGTLALAANTTGQFNTSVGYGTLQNNTTGGYQTAFGVSSLTSNTSGFNNSAYGTETLMANTTGTMNSAFGFQALKANISGSQNSAFGLGALGGNTTGGSNSVFGFGSLVGNTTGTGNSILGHQVMTNNVIGGSNIAIGFDTANTISNGTTAATRLDNSIMIGSKARPSADSQTNQIVIGTNIAGNGSNTTVIGNFSTATSRLYGNLLLGSNTNGTGILQVTGNSTFTGNVTMTGTLNGLKMTASPNTVFGDSSTFTSNTTGDNNAVFGSSSLASNTTGRFNSAFGSNSLSNNTTGSFNSAFGRNALQTNEIGSNNTAMGVASGRQAGNGLNNSNNTTVGFSSLTLADGSNNVALGASAGSYLPDGTTFTNVVDNSIFIGSGSKTLADNLTNQIVIGTNATSNGSNTTVIGNATTTASRLYGNLLLGSNTNGTGMLQVTGNSTFTGNVTMTGTLNGSKITSGTNTAFGDSTTLAANTTGASNAAFGNNALTANTTGTNQSALGFGALNSNTTGNQNTAIGFNTLNKNTIGGNNTAIGNSSLFANTTGNSNTALGGNSLGSNTTGIQNTSVGLHSLLNNTIGSVNTAVGVTALFNNTTGAANVGIGSSALNANTTGLNNIGVGNSSGQFIADGTTPATLLSNSIMIGTNTKPLADSQTNQIVIGHSSTGNGSNTTVIGNATTATSRLYGNLLLGSNTNGIGILQVTGNSNFTGSTTASAGTARAINLTPTLVASANNDNLVGLDITSTYTTGVFTGVKTHGLRVDGISIGRGLGNVLTNSVFGNGALNNNTIGGNNTSVGFQSMQSNTTGSSNVGLGHSSLANNTTGGNNIGIGVQAGQFIADGTTPATSLSGSIMIGTGSKPLGDTQSNQIVIGNGSVGNGSNTTVIGGSVTSSTRLYGNLLLGSNTNGTGVLQVTGNSSFTGNVGVNVTPTSSIHANGTFALSTATSGTSNSVVLLSTGTFTPPTASTVSGRIYIIRNTSAAATVTVANVLDYTATTAADFSLTSALGSIMIISDGTSWFRIQ